MIAVLAALALGQAVLPLPAPSLSASRPAVDPCLGLERQNASVPATLRPVTALDQATLVDIGRSDPYDSPSPFGISPDGTQIAFVVRRGNPAANAFCQKLVTMPLAGKGGLRELDRGGTFIRDTFVLRNFTAVVSGYAKVITPHWAPDGSRLAYLKRVDDRTQVWIVDARGGRPAWRAGDLPDDVEDFAWGSDGTSLIVATRPDLRLGAEAIAREARSGFLFDDRFAPQFAPRPLPTGPLPTHFGTIDLATGAVRTALPAERERLSPAVPVDRPRGATGYTTGAGGVAAWTQSKDPARLVAPTSLVIRRRNGTTVTCDTALCEGTRQLWWSRDGHTLLVLQRTGWGASRTALLRWDSRRSKPVRILSTDDALIGCLYQTRELVCARERASAPRQVIAIDPRTGAQRLILDPNPDWRGLQRGAVRRFTFRNAYGVESYADLVLPPGHLPGQTHPLVVVQYVTDGFLRGGTGDEAPIQVLAAKGFVVLSFSRPDFPAWVLAASDERELRRRNRVDWLDRRSVQSSLQMAIARAIATGTVDPARMGISGFSDGTSTTQWALINSSLFKVASLGACCEDMVAYALAGGPAFEQFGRDMGYRFFEDDAPRFWRPMSLALNVDRIEAPILVQTGDSEYQIGLDVVSAFRRRGKAFELYVLNDEPHFKWQPAHRLAIYQRTVDWFAFWLQHTIDCAPDKAGQYERWQAMRGAPLPGQLRCDGQGQAVQTRTQASASTRSSSR